MNIGLQTLIPKQGEQSVIANYRQILVLRSTYKITSKTLANRFQPFLSSWIKPRQTCFVEGKCILDNVFMAFGAMEWAKEVIKI